MFAEREKDKRFNGESWFFLEAYYPYFGEKGHGWFIAGQFENSKDAIDLANDRSVPARVWEVSGKVIHQNNISDSPKRGRPKKEDGPVDFHKISEKKKKYMTPEREEDERLFE